VPADTADRDVDHRSAGCGTDKRADGILGMSFYLLRRIRVR
jgi:hypothetical protein